MRARECHRHDEPAVLRVLRSHAAAVHGRCALRDRETDAGAFSRYVFRIDTAGAIEGLEDSRELRFGHTGSVITHRNANLACVLGKGHVDRELRICAPDKKCKAPIDAPFCESAGLQSCLDRKCSRMHRSQLVCPNLPGIARSGARQIKKS